MMDDYSNLVRDSSGSIVKDRKLRTRVPTGKPYTVVMQGVFTANAIVEGGWGTVIPASLHEKMDTIIPPGAQGTNK